MADQATCEESVPNSALYDAIDAYVEAQMRRLNMPGVALAIVEGEKIVHLRGFGRARPGGELPSPHSPLQFFHAVPWVLRGQLLLPALQVLGVAGALRRLRRWHLDPESRPRDRRTWGFQILLPLIPNLVAALTLKPLLGQRRGYLRLYMSDWAWLATICGSLGLLWSLTHAGLVVGALGKTSPDQSPVRRQALRQLR